MAILIVGSVYGIYFVLDQYRRTQNNRGIRRGIKIIGGKET
jgi:hypothetical protein